MPSAPAPATATAPAPDVDVASVEEQVIKWRDACEPFIVIRQEVDLEVDFQNKSIKGTSTIHLFLNHDKIDEVLFDARQCNIDLDNVTVDGVRTRATYSDPYGALDAPDHWQIGAAQHHVMKKRMQHLTPLERPDVPIVKRVPHLLGCVPADGSLVVSLNPPEEFKAEPRRKLVIKTSRVEKDALQEEQGGIKISIPFTSKNIRDGLQFVGVDNMDMKYPHVYTRHSIEPGTAACIFPCIDDPGSRHPWRISIKFPKTLGEAFPEPPPAQNTELAPLNSNRKRKADEPPPSPSGRHLTLSEEDKMLDMTVICSGNYAGEQVDPNDGSKKIMTFECQSSCAQHISFAIGPFETVNLWHEFRTEEADEKLGANAAKIYAYCLPGRVSEVLHTCHPIVTAADYFAPEFGKYPFESYKMVFVEDLVPDTVAATSMSLCSTRLLYPEDIIDPEIEITRKLVHALACQYFGVHIVPNERSDLWLAVGIPWFMTDLFMRTICGNNWYRFHLKTLSDKLVETDVNRPSLHALGKHLHIGDFELDFMSLKAPLVLFILDQRMSKIPGSTGIVRVISNMVSNANIRNTDPEATTISTAEFQKSCEKKTAYRPEEFWKQWVYGAGCPRFNIRQRFNKKNLNVDIIIEQTQGVNEVKGINKEDFWREYQEDLNHVYAGQVPRVFTGPITIRIHEADGTPYEHYQVITDKEKGGMPFSIAYNTKYKRLKRTKKAQASAANASNIDKQVPQEDDVVYFNMFGDVLGTPKDAADWGLQDWDDDVQREMDQESYEWIRFDCNFEWLCETTTDMRGYMYLAQLQQDRDVVAHQDAMLYFKRGRRHGVAATIETRTVMDRRYYHGIRTMAIEDLPKQATEELNYIGLAQLIMCYRSFFCKKTVSKTGQAQFSPEVNDFQDKAQYNVQCAIPGAIARTRKNGRCSRDGRAFLMELLLFNNNDGNEFSDEFFIAKLLEALATSLIPENYDGKETLVDSLDMENEDDREFRAFVDKTIEQIETYRRMDEYTFTYQNLWTRTAMDCKMRLMKARVIRVSPLEFVQYLQDDNSDLVRIKAFDCLIELNMLSKTPIMKLLLSYMTTDTSPYVRDRLFKIFCRGIAAVAFGENKSFQPEPERVVAVDESGLIIDGGDAEISQRQREAARTEDIIKAIAALKDELKGKTELQTAIWSAFNSSVIGLREKTQLLEICAAMFEPEDSLLITMDYPKAWRCTRTPDVPRAKNWVAPIVRNPGKSLMMKFYSENRTKPRVTREIEEPPTATAVLPPVTATDSRPEAPKPETTKKIKISSRPSFGGSFTGSPGAASPGPSSLPPAPSRKNSISISAAPRPAAPAAQAASPAPLPDSIAVRPLARVSTPLPGTPPPSALPKPSSQHLNGTAKAAEKKPKPLKKRKSDDVEGTNNNERPKKVAKTGGNGVRPGANGRPSKVVTAPFTSWSKLPERVRRTLKEPQPSQSDSIHATPKRPGNLSGTAAVTSGSARPSSPASASGLQTPGTATSTGRTELPKARKPLPGSAPHPSAGHPATPMTSSQRPNSTTNGSAGGNASTPAPTAPDPEPKTAPRKVLKLKIKGSSSSTPLRRSPQ
ncbi:hypothetical protein V8F06_005487 [Rhypophila decipiens]